MIFDAEPRRLAATASVAGVCAAALLALASPADAKCVLARYTVHASVVSGADKEPVTSARVSFFPNEGDQEQLRRDSGQRLATTDQVGRLTFEFLFDTYSGSGLWGDRCKAKVRLLEVVVVHPEHRVRRLRFDVDSRISRRLDRAFEVTLPSIELERLRP